MAEAGEEPKTRKEKEQSPAPSGLSDLLAQRDKHLSQFMEINAKGSFAVLTAILAVVFGIDKVKGLLKDNDWYCQIVGGTGFAIALLAYGAVRLSVFHTSRIRRIQERILNGESAPVRGDFQIIPRLWDANFAIFVGIMVLVVGALAALFLSAQLDRSAG